MINIIMGISMLLTGLITLIATPVLRNDQLQVRPNLESIIPHTVPGWKIDHFSQLRMINPETQGKINKIYDQTLARTYINARGERIMLSIAYGSNQSTDLQVHRPEICYTSSGFSISNISKASLDTSIGTIPVMHLVATHGVRNEPITYWIRIGDSLTRGWLEQKLASIGYGLGGKIPDGLLLRVSSISKNENDSYRIQQEFLSDLLNEMKQSDRYWLVGNLPRSDTAISQPANPTGEN